MEQTIAAVATPNAAGGLSVIRISGEQAIEIAERVFKPLYKKSISEMDGYTAALGRVYADGEPLDEAVATVFRAPKSYTGEDVVELSCHGGIFVTRRVLRAVLNAGARGAGAGEFTKRAFLNGRMSLTQAEAVIDLINANGRAGARAAVHALDGALFSRIRGMIDTLTDLSGNLAAWADFPEEDLEDLDLAGLQKELCAVKEALDTLLSSYDTGRLIHDGVKTAIVGKPNVGKSTLMNLLSGCEKSIVTEIAGTTRDVVEESVVLGDVVLRLADTAGIRDTDDMVERVGVTRAKSRIETSDLVLAVFDGSIPLSEEDGQLLSSLADKPCIAVINKSDLPQVIETDEISKYIKQTIVISAQQDNGTSGALEALQAAVESAIKAEHISGMDALLANERQHSCAKAAANALENALNELEMGMTLDAVTVSVSDSLEALLELTGEQVSDKIIDNVFARFCVGK